MSIESTLRCEFDHKLKPLHLVEEISHRVMNEYAEAVATLDLAASSTTDPQARNTLTKAAGGSAPGRKPIAPCRRLLSAI